jgi:hypothetical protein
MEEKVWMDEFNEASDVNQEIHYRLCSLAKSFRRVGNHDVAKELESYAIALCETANKIRDAVGHKLDADMKQSWASTENMLKGTLVGMAMGNPKVAKTMKKLYPKGGDK